MHKQPYIRIRNSVIVCSYSLMRIPQCSQGLTRALHLFEQLINDPESYCWLAEGARLLGQQRVCRINVDIHFGQNTVLYCLEGEKLNTALMEISKMVSLARSLPTVYLSNCFCQRHNIYLIQSVNGEVLYRDNMSTHDRLYFCRN